MENREVVTLTEEEYKKIVEGKERLEKQGYRIEESGDLVIVTFPNGEKYVFRKPRTMEVEVDQVTLPREGKRYRAKITRIKIAPVFKLYAEKGFNVERMLQRCEKLEDPRQRWNCVKRLKDVGYLIEFEVPEIEMQDFEIIRFSVHKNSRFRELATCYRQFKKGMEVWVLLTDRGRFRIVCPEEEE